MQARITAAIVLALFVLVPAAPARADIVLTPYVGSFFGGDITGKPAAYGASAAFMGGGVFGMEIGFNYAPKFVSAGVSNEDIAQLSLMGNLIIGIPMGSSDQGGHVRPYVTGGAGLFRITSQESQFFDRISSNDFAVNFGGGIMAFFNEHVGFRGDVRYFRTLNDSNANGGVDLDFGDLKFWKWDVGAAFKF